MKEYITYIMFFWLPPASDQVQSAFNSIAREEIGKRRLSDLMCDNTGIQQVPADAWRNLAFAGNELVDCSGSDVNRLDVSKINLVLEWVEMEE